MLENKIISVKPFGGSKLYSKASAEELRDVCYSYLRYTDELTINMAGIKEITPGFSLEAFGPLYVDAKKYNKKIKFASVSKEIRPIILKSIINYIKVTSS